MKYQGRGSKEQTRRILAAREQERAVMEPLNQVADKVLSYRAPARTAKAKKRQRARRKAMQ